MRSLFTFIQTYTHMQHYFSHLNLDIKIGYPYLANAKEATTMLETLIPNPNMMPCSKKPIAPPSGSFIGLIETSNFEARDLASMISSMSPANATDCSDFVMI